MKRALFEAWHPGLDAVRELSHVQDGTHLADESGQANCVVFGTPNEAIAAGAVNDVLPLTQTAAKLLEHLRRPSAALSNRL